MTRGLDMRFLPGEFFWMVAAAVDLTLVSVLAAKGDERQNRDAMRSSLSPAKLDQLASGCQAGLAQGGLRARREPDDARHAATRF